MRVYFVRHGQSISNAAVLLNRDNSSQDKGDALTELGWEQGEALGERLKGEGITRIISSPMRRAQETASAIEEVLQVGIEVHDDIFEIQQDTPFYGLPNEQRGPYSSLVWMKMHDDDPDYRQGDAESFNDIVGRVKRLQSYLEKSGEEHILVVTHGNYLRFFLGCSVLREEFSPRHFQTLWNVKAANTGISIFDFDDDERFADGIVVGGWRLVTWMDHRHL